MLSVRSPTASRRSNKSKRSESNDSRSPTSAASSSDSSTEEDGSGSSQTEEKQPLNGGSSSEDESTSDSSRTDTIEEGFTPGTAGGTIASLQRSRGDHVILEPDNLKKKPSSPGSGVSDSDTPSTSTYTDYSSTILTEKEWSRSSTPLEDWFDEAEMEAEFKKKRATEEMIFEGGGAASAGGMFSVKPSFWLGLYRDFYRRGKHYFKDWKNGCHSSMLWVILIMVSYLLIDCMAYGALYQIVTSQIISFRNILCGVSISGMIFSIFGGQPNLMIGPSAGLLQMVAAIYWLAVQLGYPFVVFYRVIGIWAGVFILGYAISGRISVFFKTTKFVHEIYFVFSTIVLFWKVFYYLIKLYLRPSSEESLALLSTILIFGVAFFSWNTKQFRYSQFFNFRIREILVILGYTLPIILFTLFAAHFRGKQIKLKSLDITKPERGHYATISFSQSNDPRNSSGAFDELGQILGVFIGFCLSQLVIFEQTLCVKSVRNYHSQCPLSVSMHWDMLAIGFMVILQGCLCVPFTVASISLSAFNVDNLMIVFDSVDPHAKMNRRRKKKKRKYGLRDNNSDDFIQNMVSMNSVADVAMRTSTRLRDGALILDDSRVNRFSGFLIYFTLFLLVLSLEGWPSTIPIAVLGGAVMTLGANRLKLENTFVSRVLLLFMEGGMRETKMETSLHVKQSTLIYWTLTQIFCVVVLLTVAFLPFIAVFYPLMLLFIIWFRDWLEAAPFIDLHELAVLDDG